MRVTVEELVTARDHANQEFTEAEVELAQLYFHSRYGCRDDHADLEESIKKLEEASDYAANHLFGINENLQNRRAEATGADRVSLV